ncbi:MAG TPA: GPW/gp25 family protein [Pseudomonadota bacterium]|nr:GPW/gp25 family protein [Pseudomonadota bacterium]
MSFLNRFLEDAPVDDLAASVARNLSALFNARPDYASPLRRFGLGDYLGQQSRKGTHLSILREMEDVIAAYEPRFRLREIKTIGRDADLTLHIVLRGLLRTARGDAPCLFGVRFNLVSGAAQVDVGNQSEVRRAP